MTLIGKKYQAIPKASKGEETIALLLNSMGIDYEREHRFSPPRRWRFDFALLDHKIAIEAEGAVWSGGRHVTPDGFMKDCEKYNAAAVQGWRVLRFAQIHFDEPIQRIAPVVQEAIHNAKRT